MDTNTKEAIVEELLWSRHKFNLMQLTAFVLGTALLTYIGGLAIGVWYAIGFIGGFAATKLYYSWKH